MSRQPKTSQDLTNELLQALLGAADEQKHAALMVLRGQTHAQPDIAVPEPFLTLLEVARQLGVSTCSLWRWGVPGHQLGGRRRFRMSEVLAYLESEVFKKKAEELRRKRARKAS